MTTWPTLSTLQSISDHQRDMLSIATSRRIGILTGGPGTGKTRSAASLLKACVGMYGAHHVAVCAPTGKAAVRITEAMRENDLGLEAKTIHRLLGVQRNGHDGGGWGFLHGRGNPLPHKVIAVDEVSMLGVDLACSFFSAVAPGSLMLLIGDTGQLPPVEHGCPMRDFIHAGMPHGELLETHRNGGDMVEACKAIREGRAWQPTGVSEIDVAGSGNFIHADLSTHTQIVGRLKRILSSCPAGIDRVWDCQVLTAIKDNSPCGKNDLNKTIQAFLNPVGTEIPHTDFREGDKVMCTSNGFLPVLIEGKLETDLASGQPVADFVANGETGRISPSRKDDGEIDKTSFCVSFDSPKRTVFVKGENRIKFELAYAITVHKSQGSEWPVVICIADPARGARFIGSRELWTTAWSRARKVCFTLGPRAAIDEDVTKSALRERKTLLSELIVEMETSVHK